MTNTLQKIIHNGDEYLLPQYSVVKVTLDGGNWANDEQTVTVEGVTSSNTIVVSPVPSSMSDYISGGIYYSAQGTDSVTFTSTTAVTNDIEVNIVILAEAGGTPTPPSPTIYTITGSTTVGSYTPSSFSDIQGCYINPDGDKMYISFWNSGSGKLAQYSLSTPFDVSTASQVNSASITKPNGFCFSDTGEYMYLSTENGNVIQRYSLSTAWDISTMSLDSGQTLLVESSHFALNVSISENGEHIYFGADVSNTYQYTLTTAYDLTTATSGQTVPGLTGVAVAVKGNGDYFYTAQSTGAVQYFLAIPYDITSTKTEIGTFSGSSWDIRALWVSNDLKYRTICSGSSIVEYEAQPMS